MHATETYYQRKIAELEQARDDERAAPTTGRTPFNEQLERVRSDFLTTIRQRGFHREYADDFDSAVQREVARSVALALTDERAAIVAYIDNAAAHALTKRDTGHTGDIGSTVHGAYDILARAIESNAHHNPAGTGTTTNDNPIER